MIIAIDFDGTIVTHEYPNIGKPLKGAIKTIKTMINNGHKIFLWTMRGSKRYNGRDLLHEAVEYLEDNDIHLNGINRSPAQFSTSPKQYADIYIDDAAISDICQYVDGNGRPMVDWWLVGRHLVARDVISDEQFNKIWDE